MQVGILSDGLRGLLLTGAFLGALLCVPAVLSQYHDTRENVEYRCLMDGDRAGAQLSDDALVAAEVTAVPAGRKCTWRGESDALVVEQTGGAVTNAALVGVVLVALATVACARKSWRILIAPWLVTLASWALVFWNAG